MRGNSFGKVFKVTTYGESHGKAMGLIIDGCPSNLEIEIKEINYALSRRRPGQSKIVTQRKEPDQAEILSGVFDGKTTGTPISLIVYNKDHKSKDYSHIKDKFRPSHADYTYQQKYDIRDYRGGGRSSARETVARVAAGAIAEKYLQNKGIEIVAYVSQVGDIKMSEQFSVTREKVDGNIVRCPDNLIAQKMIKHIEEIKKQGDTIGGMITCVIKGMPAGIGEPVFDKLHADLGKAMLSINAVKGFEYGSGFRSIGMKGSEHNDIFEKVGDKIQTKTNYSGGIQGGISNGMDIYFNVAFKPVATIMRDQKSIDLGSQETTVSGKGRHDPCVVPRAVPIVESMTALTIIDHLLRQKTTNLD